jgi:hypothetical protein
VHVHVHACACMFVCVHVVPRACMCICVFAHICVCMCVCVCVLGADLASVGDVGVDQPGSPTGDSCIAAHPEASAPSNNSAGTVSVGSPTFFPPRFPPLTISIHLSPFSLPSPTPRVLSARVSSTPHSTPLAILTPPTHPVCYTGRCKGEAASFVQQRHRCVRMRARMHPMAHESCPMTAMRPLPMT